MFLETSDTSYIVFGYLAGFRQAAVRIEGRLGAADVSRETLARLRVALEPLLEGTAVEPRKETPPTVQGQLLDSLLDWQLRAMQVPPLVAVDRGRWCGRPKVGEVITIEYPCSAIHVDASVRLFTALLDIVNATAQKGSGPPAVGPLKKQLEKLRSTTLSSSNPPHFIREALVLDMPVMDLPEGVVQVGWGIRGHWFDSSFTQETSAVGARLSRLKPAAATVLRRAGVPVPAHSVVASVEAALQAAAKLGYPVVVKPTNLDGGEGVHAGLLDAEEVRYAFTQVQKLGQPILVEKHVEGRDYRIVIFRGKLIAAIERMPGGVTGNGHDTIAQLLDTLNAEPGRGQGAYATAKHLELDHEALQVLRVDGLTIDDVPADGDFVRLRRAANFARGGSVVNVFDEVHPDNRDLAIRATEVMRLDLSGVDLLIPDIRRSWLETGAAICEINSQPYLGRPKPRNLFAQILRSLVPGDGRIPVVVIAGLRDDRAMSDELMQSLIGQGIVAGCADSSRVRVGAEVVAHAPAHLYNAGRMLLIDRRVELVVLFIADVAALDRGSPVDRIDVIVAAGAQGGSRDALVQALRAYGNPSVLQDIPADAMLPAIVDAIKRLRPADGKPSSD